MLQRIFLCVRQVVLVRPDGKDTEGMLNDKATDSDGFRVACLQGIFVLQAWVVMKVERDQLDMHHMNSDLLPLLVHHGANCQEVARWTEARVMLRV